MGKKIEHSIAEIMQLRDSRSWLGGRAVQLWWLVVLCIVPRSVAAPCNDQEHAKYHTSKESGLSRIRHGHPKPK